MKRTLLLAIVLVFVGTARATVFAAVAAEPNACIQQDYSRSVPFALPAPEPNQPWGVILGPVPNDPNRWEEPAGEWKRDWGRCCDEDGDSVTIEALTGPSPAAVQIDRETGRWSFAATVFEGPNLWRFRVSDGKDDRIVTVAVWGRKNQLPVAE